MSPQEVYFIYLLHVKNEPESMYEWEQKCLKTDMIIRMQSNMADLP